MGGGKTQATNAQTTYDNDVVAGEGALAIGQDATLISSEGDVETGGVGVTGSGNSTSYNSGVQLGIGSTYTVASMDNNTRDILAGSLALVSNNANNLMTLAANDKTAIQYDVAPVVAEKTTLEQVKELSPGQTWGVVVFLLILSALFLNAATNRGSKKQ